MDICGFGKRPFGWITRVADLSTRQCFFKCVEVFWFGIVWSRHVDPSIPIVRINTCSGMAVINFTQADRLVSLFSKVLIHCQDIGVPVAPVGNVEGLLASQRWVKSAHQRETGSATHRLLAIGTIKSDS